MKSLTWESDSMEPTVDFGDEIEITPTKGIEGDGVYMMLLDRKHIKPANMRRLCAPTLTVIRRVERMRDGRLRLMWDNPTYGHDEVVHERDLRNWRIAGTVSVTKRNGLGFRDMNNRAVPGVVAQMADQEARA